MTMIVPILYAILRTFFSENVDASLRRVISLSRGWRHVPGLSTSGAFLVGVALTGVDTGIATKNGTRKCFALLFWRQTAMASKQADGNQGRWSSAAVGVVCQMEV